jgi:hypothetical protein
MSQTANETANESDCAEPSVHLGDLIVETTNYKATASTLEGEAPAGGIVISATADVQVSSAFGTLITRQLTSLQLHACQQVRMK